jgi:hypothetical protein
MIYPKLSLFVKATLKVNFGHWLLLLLTPTYLLQLVMIIQSGILYDIFSFDMLKLIKYVRVWNMKTKKLIKVLELEKRIRSCAFSQDGQELACGLSDGRLVVLKVEYVRFIITIYNGIIFLMFKLTEI